MGEIALNDDVTVFHVSRKKQCISHLKDHSVPPHVAKQQASATYLKAVKRSHFISSDKVVRLADEVESIFTKHFANNDRKKAMKYLKPQQHKDSHIITFLVGT
ncbi:Acid phosphatase pho1 [Asimina triloba]